MPTLAPAQGSRYTRPMLARPLLLPLLVVGCLLSPAAAEYTAHDPIEGLNRQTHALNDWLDRNILRPVALGWKTITPNIVRDSLRNFDDNLRSPVIAANDVLQWKWRAAGEQVARFGVNTTVGVLGFRDVAAEWGLEKQSEDTGQTLGLWGIPPGPYVVLPLLGPSNPRDIVGMFGDSFLSVYWIVAPWYASLGYRSVDVVNRRAIFDDDLQSTRAAALDYYVFIRNAYGQRREALINDMAEDETDGEDDLYEFDDDLYEIDEN